MERTSTFRHDLLSVPPQSHLASGLFEHAYRTENALTYLEYFIETYRQSGISAEEIEERVVELGERALTDLDEAKKDLAGDVQSIYRFATSTALLREMVYVPRIFSDTTSVRQQQIDVTADLPGLQARILEQLLEERVDIKTSEYRKAYRGLINEHTALAAINMSHHSDIAEHFPDTTFAALPSLLHEDIYSKTDGWVYARRGSELRTTAVQIKSSRQETELPKDILKITMSDYGNSYYGLSKGIVKFMKQGELDDTNRQHIINLLSDIESFQDRQSLSRTS